VAEAIAGGRVSKRTHTFETIQKVFEEGGEPYDVAVDPSDNYLFVLKGGQVQVYHPGASKNNPNEVFGAGAGPFTGAKIAVDSVHDRAYISDEETGEIQIWRLEAASGAGPHLTLHINEGEGTVVSDPAGIECSGEAGETCIEEFPEGSEVTLTASPAAGYRFRIWTNCPRVNGRQCTVTMSEARSVGAFFVPVHKLTIARAAGSEPGIIKAHPPGDVCPFRCSSTTYTYKQGEEVTLKSYSTGRTQFVEFKNGTGDAEACDGLTECTYTVGTSDSTVEGLFEKEPRDTLSLEKAGGGEARITSSRGVIECLRTCSSASGTDWPGEEITINWELGPGTSSIDWGTGAGTCTGSSRAVSGSCRVTLSSSRELVATLE
jgi:Divergent InlB B-repeat domain